MGNFCFKQFTVEQSSSAMKVNTDGVLLGAWCPIPNINHRVLDIGTGTGVIALMIAQRDPNPNIDAVEIDLPSAQEAASNFINSKWKDRLRVLNLSFSQFCKEEILSESRRFNLIISNPPFFENSLKSVRSRKMNARHCDNTLPFQELAKGVSQLLCDGGEFGIILPVEEHVRFNSTALDNGLYLVRECLVYTKPGGIPKRVMAVYSNIDSNIARETLFIHNEAGEYSKEYRALTKEFYLAF